MKEVSISGSVSFPNREVLTFGSTGIVDEVLVEEGERVVEGQTMATLDAETIAGLEEAAAKARVDLRDAEEALADYLEPPDDLVIAEAKHKVAEAELSLQTATEALGGDTRTDSSGRGGRRRGQDHEPVAGSAQRRGETGGAPRSRVRPGFGAGRNGTWSARG